MLKKKILRFKIHLFFLQQEDILRRLALGRSSNFRFVNEGIRIYQLIRGRRLLNVANERTILQTTNTCAQAYNVHGRFCKFLHLINNNNKPHLLLLPH